MDSDSHQISDEKILQMLQDNRATERGFRLLVAKYQERLYWQIRRMVFDHEDANDVLQNCLVKVFRNIQRFEQKSQLYTWLYRIATNEAITFLKKQKRRRAVPLDDEEGSAAREISADPYFDGNRAQQLLQEAMATLPDKQKQVFILRYYEEMPYQEMSELLETSVGALKASYHHAVKKVEQHLRQPEA